MAIPYKCIHLQSGNSYTYNDICENTEFKRKYDCFSNPLVIESKAVELIEKWNKSSNLWKYELIK
jgi:hypothetical protein